MSNQQSHRGSTRLTLVLLFILLTCTVLYIILSSLILSNLLFAIILPTVAYLVTHLRKESSGEAFSDFRREWVTATILLASFIGLCLVFLWPSQAIRIAVDLPLTGLDRVNGQDVLNGVRLAVHQEQSLPIGNHYLAFDINNDIKSDDQIGSTPQKGLASAKVCVDNIKNLINNPEVAGIIGPY